MPTLTIRIGQLQRGRTPVKVKNAATTEGRARSWLGTSFIVSALFVALPVLALGALFSRAMDAHGAPLASVEQVRRGMRPEKVKEILGTPNWSGQWNDGTAWVHTHCTFDTHEWAGLSILQSKSR